MYAHPSTILRSFLAVISLCLVVGCARVERRPIEATAYCGCGECCDWERGRWKYLELNFWSRYVSEGARKGRPYDGRTASGTRPRQPDPGLFSGDSIRRPWKVPLRIILFPWFLLPHPGTLAADTAYYRFGTRMHVPGYGWGVVEDRGGAIRGPDRIDLYYRSHNRALEWGRRRCEVRVRRTR